MKPYQSLILVSLVLTLVFTACTSSDSDKGVAATETTPAIVENKTDSTGQSAEANKKLVTDFFQSLYGDKDSTAIDKYIADNIIQHNPILQDGKEWLKNALRPFLTNPNITKTKVDIKHASAEGDMVWLMVKQVTPNGRTFARVDVFRVQNGKIVENWLIEQEVPEKSANTNTLF